MSNGHTKNTLNYEATQCKPGESRAEKALFSMNKAAVSQLGTLFRNAHALAKTGRPFTDFKWLCDLDEAKGLNIIGNTNRNDKRAREFVAAIATNVRSKVSSTLRESKFASLQ